jgi:hypothetical protein
MKVKLHVTDHLAGVTSDTGYRSCPRGTLSISNAMPKQGRGHLWSDSHKSDTKMDKDINSRSCPFECVSWFWTWETTARRNRRCSRSDCDGHQAEEGPHTHTALRG